MSFNIAVNCDGNESVSSMWIEDKRKLCRTLDARSLWKDLASHRDLNLSPDDVLILAQQEPRLSPTDGLLHIMANKRTTMLDLFHYLKAANLLSAMEIVKKYVPSHWHTYLQPDTIASNDMTIQGNPVNLLPQPPPPLIEEASADPQRLMLPQDMLDDSLSSDDPLMSSLPELSSTQRRAAHTIMATRHFDIKDITDATENFDAKYLISKGQFSSIYEVDLQNTKFAAKVYNLDYKSVLADLQDTRLHSHENIVPITGKCFNGERVILLYELMAHGSLKDLLDSGGMLNMATRVHILRDAARGLQYLHSNDPPLLHRNVKSKNILLDSYFKAKLSDFGMAVHANKFESGLGSQRYTHYSTRQDTSMVQRSKGYCAKEVLGGKFTHKTDTYAFGVVILEVCTGLPAFDPTRARVSDQELVNYIDEHVSNDDDAWALADRSCRWARQTYQDLFNLALRCKAERAKDRPTMNEVFQQLDDIVNDLPASTEEPNKVRQQQSTDTVPLSEFEAEERKLPDQQAPVELPEQRIHCANSLPPGYTSQPSKCTSKYRVNEHGTAHMSMPSPALLQTQISETNSSNSLDFSNIGEQSMPEDIGEQSMPEDVSEQSMPEDISEQSMPEDGSLHLSSADVLNRDLHQVDTSYMEHTPESSVLSPSTPTAGHTIFDYLKTEAQKYDNLSSHCDECEEDTAELDPDLLAELEKLNLAVSG